RARLRRGRGHDRADRLTGHGQLVGRVPPAARGHHPCAAGGELMPRSRWRHYAVFWVFTAALPALAAGSVATGAVGVAGLSLAGLGAAVGSQLSTGASSSRARAADAGSSGRMVAVTRTTNRRRVFMTAARAARTSMVGAGVRAVMTDRTSP